MRVTLFPNVKANTLEKYDVTWEQIYTQCANPAVFSEKSELPLIKLATFGNQITGAGSYRHDANVLAISGLEGDYDGGEVSVDTAVQCLNLAGIYALVYTSPSHTTEKPRWRVLAPLSAETVPSQRRELMARLNGAFGGILAHESFTLSQTYYFGSVRGVIYECQHSLGNYVDLVPNLTPMYPELSQHSKQQNMLVSEVTDETLSELESALCHISADDRVTWISVGQDLACLGDAGFALWDAWSKKSDKYNPDDMWRWNTFTGDRTDHRAVFAKAQRNGWINPKKGLQVNPAEIFGTVEGEYMPFNMRLSETDIPDRSKRGKAQASTLNLTCILKHYGITYYYDELLKKHCIDFPANQNVINDISDNGKLQEIKSLLAINEVPIETAERITALLMNKVVNPIKDFITGKPWDNVSRLNDFYNTVLVDINNVEYRNRLLRMWLVQCVAAMDAGESSPIVHKVPKFEAVLIFQSGQGRMKTTWIRSLVPPEYNEYVIDNITLDTENKDSRKAAVSAWICELGELDGTFKKSDIARLKGFLSSCVDEIRLPYDRLPCKFRRRTSFFASVNESRFLVDDTGNRRFFPLQIIGTNPFHSVDMQQLWAEIWGLYLAGDQWWPDAEMDEMINHHHLKHSQIDHIEDAMRSKFDLDTILDHGKLYTCTDILTECGWGHTTKMDVNAVAKVLRRLGIQEKRTAKKKGFMLALQPIF